ncbi:MAG TPA: hypothetical protein VJ499_04760, partial [Flavisolibacter sp.]|nr:hypothetical protein [Flavisolibacter sp.]
MKVTLQNMKFVAASLLVSTIGYSQVHVGAKLGLTFPGISYRQFDGQKFSKHMTGIQAGVFFS